MGIGGDTWFSRGEIHGHWSATATVILFSAYWWTEVLFVFFLFASCIFFSRTKRVLCCLIWDMPISAFFWKISFSRTRFRKLINFAINFQNTWTNLANKIFTQKRKSHSHVKFQCSENTKKAQIGIKSLSSLFLRLAQNVVQSPGRTSQFSNAHQPKCQPRYMVANLAKAFSE